jgi:hypothetical protein
MDTSRTTPKLTKRNRILLFVSYCLILAVIFVVGAEVILRLKGVEPWRPREVAIQVSPGGRLVMKHSSLGYSHIPGRFTVTLGTGYSFKVTHLPNTLRITHPLDGYEIPREKEEIWIFGCSFTYGWGLNDEQTYPWLLQERFPAYELVNFGVSGYGTIHSLLQFRDALKLMHPKVAVLAYADFHDIRNTFLRIRQKETVPYNKLGPLLQPYARLDEDGELRYSMAEVAYREFPLMRHMALAHFIETMYDRYEDKLYRSHAVSEALVEEMGRLAREHEVKFVVAGIAESRDMHRMLYFAQEHGIPSVDISVDLRIEENMNATHDGHPSAIANKKYADKLEAFLKAEILR